MDWFEGVLANLYWLSGLELGKDLSLDKRVE